MEDQDCASEKTTIGIAVGVPLGLILLGVSTVLAWVSLRKRKPPERRHDRQASSVEISGTAKSHSQPVAQHSTVTEIDGQAMRGELPANFLERP